MRRILKAIPRSRAAGQFGAQKGDGASKRLTRRPATHNRTIIHAHASRATAPTEIGGRSVRLDEARTGRMQSRIRRARRDGKPHGPPMNLNRRGACAGLTQRIERSQPPARASAVGELRLALRSGLLSDIYYEVNSSMPIEQRLADALADCDRLQEETRQLRERLGLPHADTTVQPVSTGSVNIASSTIRL